MGTWGTAIKDNDAFADVYSEFYDLYNEGGQPDHISQKLVETNWEILGIEEEKNSFWFALGLAQWETKSLDVKVLTIIEEIITSGEDLNLWRKLDAAEADLKKRRNALEKFLNKLKSDRPKAKLRKRAKLQAPIFATGDCITFKMKKGNYGGAVVLAVDKRPETAYNLVATTRLNQLTKPTPGDFINSEVLVQNSGNFGERPSVMWHAPDLFFKSYAELYEIVGRIAIDIEYEADNTTGTGYLFHPAYTAGWLMNESMERQLESENIKPKPNKSIMLKQLIEKRKWWQLW